MLIWIIAISLAIIALVVVIVALRSSRAAANKPQQYDVLAELNSQLQGDYHAVLSNPRSRSKKGDIVLCQVFDQIGPLGLTYRSWNAIADDVPELSNYFTSLWLPPPSKSTGNPGYIPESYSDLNSYWGSRDDFARCVQTIRGRSMDAMVDIVFHHALGSDPKEWFKLDFVHKDKPVDYLPLWQWNNNFNPDGFQRSDVGKDIIDTTNSQPSCLAQQNGVWKVNQNCVPAESPTIDCSIVAPIYNIDPAVGEAGLLNPGGLSALNLCSLDILRAQIKFLWKLNQIGVNAFRYDQANGIPPAMFQLYNNSSPAQTRDILQRIMTYCLTARMYPQCADLYRGQIEDQIKTLSDGQISDLTAPPHDLAVAEAFTYSVEENDSGYDFPDALWWALVPELKRMNVGLGQKDKIGVFDFAFNRVLYKCLGYDINTSQQPLCVNGKGYGNMVYFPTVTLDSNFWYEAFSQGFPETAGSGSSARSTRSVPLVMYNNQEYCSRNPCQVFTFVENHDDDGIMKMWGYTQDYRGYQDEGFVSYSRMEVAYFILLMMPGIPTVWALHFHWFRKIRLFLVLRDTLGITFDSKLRVNTADNTGKYGRLTWVITTPAGKTYTFAVIDTIGTYPMNSIFNLPKIFETKMYVSWADVAQQGVLMQVYEGEGDSIK